jgi:N-acetylglucosamine-6-phosphate deacetylase
MSTTLLHVARAFTPATEIPDAAIVFRDGVIESVGPRGAITLPAGAHEIVANDKIAAPGFLDVHIHGAGGHDVMEASEDALRAISSVVAAHGTTSFVATTVTASPESICKSAEGIASYSTSRANPMPKSSASISKAHLSVPRAAASIHRNF